MLWYKKISRKIPPGLKIQNFSCNYIAVTMYVIHIWMKEKKKRQWEVLQAPPQNNQNRNQLICWPDVCPSKVLGFVNHLLRRLFLIVQIETFTLFLLNLLQDGLRGTNSMCLWVLKSIYFFWLIHIKFQKQFLGNAKKEENKN